MKCMIKMLRCQISNNMQYKNHLKCDQSIEICADDISMSAGSTKIFHDLIPNFLCVFENDGKYVLLSSYKIKKKYTMIQLGDVYLLP